MKRMLTKNSIKHQKNVKEIYSDRLGIGYTVTNRNTTPHSETVIPTLNVLSNKPLEKIVTTDQTPACDDRITKNIPSYDSTSYDHLNK
jgi:hypothetical protein